MINNPANIGNLQATSIEFNKCSNEVTSLVSNKPVLLVKANQKRAYGVFVNNSNTLITLILGEPSKGSIERGIPLNPGGGSYEITWINLYKGSISAVCDSNAKISWVECEE